MGDQLKNLWQWIAGQGAAKQAAQGAALLADGLAGGSHAPLVDALAIRRAWPRADLIVAASDGVHVGLGNGAAGVSRQ